MKKSLVALAALAVAGMASAQSSVTLFGVVDAAVSGYSNTSESRLGSTATVSQSGLSSSGYNASRIGFRGTEDLGAGLAASFWLEAGINTDTGNGTANGGGLQFNRRATVSLSGNFGEVRLGRDYTPTYWNDTVFDPFGTNGVGTSLIYSANNAFSDNENYIRASNSVGYFLPSNLGGFYGQLMYAFNEKIGYSPAGLTPTGLPTLAGQSNNIAAAVNAGPFAVAANPDNARAGRYIGGRAGYATGPLDVAVSYGSSTVGSNFYDGSTTSLDTWNLGATYDFGPVKVFGEYSGNTLKTERDNAFLAGFFDFADPKAKGWLVGATVPVGAGLFRASYSGVRYDNISYDEPKADKFALGYVYNLSKRTAVYTTVARVNNKNGANLSVGGPAFVATSINGAPLTPKSSTGYDFGIRHSF